MHEYVITLASVRVCKGVAGKRGNHSFIPGTCSYFSQLLAMLHLLDPGLHLAFLCLNGSHDYNSGFSLVGLVLIENGKVQWSLRLHVSSLPVWAVVLASESRLSAWWVWLDWPGCLWEGALDSPDWITPPMGRLIEVTGSEQALFI